MFSIFGSFRFCIRKILFLLFLVKLSERIMLCACIYIYIYISVLANQWIAVKSAKSNEVQKHVCALESNKWFFFFRNRLNYWKGKCDHWIDVWKKKKKKKKNVTLSHERAWFSTEMDFKTSLKCISSIYICTEHDFVTEDENAEVEFFIFFYFFFRKNYTRVSHTYFENHARGTNFLGKIIIARVSVHWI